MFSMTFQALRIELTRTPSANKNAIMLFVASVCIIAPLEISQLSFAIVGALSYALLQAIFPRPPKTRCQLEAEREHRERERNRFAKGGEVRRISNSKESNPNPQRNSSWKPTQASIKPEVYQPSSVPVSAPKFASIGWEAEVNELVAQLMPGTDEDQAVQRLVLHVKKIIETLFPEVEVTGFAYSGLKSGKAFGVAVPEVDVVANISPHALASRLQSGRPKALDQKRLLKSAIRQSTDALVGSGGLKFRRSAFRGEEPRVTLLVPSSLGFFTDSMPVDFSINSVTPFYTAAFLTECGQIEPRAKALILLVKRWAKDRGICHAAKGHLSPYLWSLLVMYFLQVGVQEEGALLPVLDAFKIAGKVAPTSKQKTSSTDPDYGTPAGKLSVAQLFCKFVQFFGEEFKWRNEAISIRLGRRASPSTSLPLHVILHENGSSDVGPSIDDPFKAGNNLGTCMNSVSLVRLREELARAVQLCAREASLTEVLQPWTPPEDAPERSSGSSPGEQDDDQIDSVKRKSSQGRVLHPAGYGA